MHRDKVTNVTGKSRSGRNQLDGFVESSGLLFFLQLGFFDAHVLEFAGFENLTALEAFDIFGVFVAGHDLYARMLALIHAGSLLGKLKGGIGVIRRADRTP